MGILHEGSQILDFCIKGSDELAEQEVQRLREVPAPSGVSPVLPRQPGNPQAITRGHYSKGMATMMLDWELQGYTSLHLIDVLALRLPCLYNW